MSANFLFSILVFTLLVMLAVSLFAFFRLRRKLMQMSQQVQILKRQRTDFISNLSHELKTPLTSIKGYTETLRDGAVQDLEKASSFLKKIEDNVERLDLLTHDILDLSRLEATDEHLQIASFDVDMLFKSLKEQFTHPLELKSQLLTLKNEIQTMTADRQLVEQALSNLILNAHRYCPEGARIEVRAKNSTHAGKTFHMLDVVDNGPGISESDLPRIFERFYRAEKSRDRASGGTGLGLAIVKHIVLSHGGLVRAKNQDSGGMIFSLLFPAS